MFLFHNCSVLLCYAWVVVGFKMALRVGSAMFYVTVSNSVYLEIFRYFTLSEEKLFRVSAVSDSLLKISPFSLIVILSLINGLPDSKGFTDFQNSLL